MYSCHLRFYLAGHERRSLELLKQMKPLAPFTHTFSESADPDSDLASGADVIFVCTEGMDAAQTLRQLASSTQQNTECILLASREQISALTEKELGALRDVWPVPASEDEIRFRFLRWQQSCKTTMDFKETSHFLDAMIDSTPNLIWFKDKDGVHEKVNSSFCKTVGKTKKQVEGRKHAYIWDVEQDDPACIESEREVMRLEKTCVSEETIQTGEGTRMLTTYKSPLYDLDGSVMGTVGIGIDVTQERLYEQEIIRKNRELEMLFTTMDCGVICHTLDGSQILSINRAALKILGYGSSEELLSDGFFMIANSVVPEDRKRLQNSIKALTKVGDSSSLSYRVRHKDGEELHVMGNIKLVQENGHLFCQRFLVDCTAQKLQEKKEQEEKTRRQMELVHALTTDYKFACFLDLDTGIGLPLRLDEDASETFGSFLAQGNSFKDSLEHYIQTFVYEEDQEMLRQAASPDRLLQELADHNTNCINYRVFANEKMEYHQLKAARAGSWDERRGVVLGFHSVDKEIRKEMEQKSLLEDALLQAKQASRAKSVFLSNMSHDIRTPMNAIVGFTSLAITHIEKKEQVEEYLKKIMTSGNHLLSLINDILDMSRIESGKIHLEEEMCQLPDILHGLHNIIQADIHAKQLDLFVDTVDVLDEEIFCDRLRLNQVLLNLLSNSIKYTPAGGSVSIRITEKKDAPAGYANFEFRIKDNGIGMSSEFVSHIFEPFERERTSTISGIQGTGLGMAITKNIVDMMNGTIEVKSEQGKGTEFIVSFPFRIQSAPKEPQIIPELEDCRVLVVDDDFNTCDSVSYMLQQLGMRAEWTLSGKEAVLRTRQAISRNNSYGVYIIDWLMPDMNGIEVVRRIQQEINEHTPIIVLTAYDWSDIEDEAREAGVTAFCSKPLFLSELRKCLCSILAKDSAQETDRKISGSKAFTGRILLVEDNSLNQEIASVILNEAGFTTEIAGNGQIALDMLQKSEPGYYRLVLMDVQMPVMGGYEATRLIRSLKNEQLSTIPIIAMTANAFEEDKQEAMECGMNGHIAKPIDIDTLFETLEQIL